jgi:hypothetical protein
MCADAGKGVASKLRHACMSPDRISRQDEAARHMCGRQEAAEHQ